MDERRIVEDARGVVVRTMQSRRELVAFSRMEAMEMDRLARELEREALEQLRTLLPTLLADQQLYQVKTRLERMDTHLQELAEREDIQEHSRALERDDITWRAFEDISWLLGIS